MAEGAREEVRDENTNSVHTLLTSTQSRTTRTTVMGGRGISRAMVGQHALDVFHDGRVSLDPHLEFFKRKSSDMVDITFFKSSFNDVMVRVLVDFFKVVVSLGDVRQSLRRDRAAFIMTVMVLKNMLRYVVEQSGQVLFGNSVVMRNVIHVEDESYLIVL